MNAQVGRQHYIKGTGRKEIQAIKCIACVPEHSLRDRAVRATRSAAREENKPYIRMCSRLVSVYAHFPHITAAQYLQLSNIKLLYVYSIKEKRPCEEEIKRERKREREKERKERRALKGREGAEAAATDAAESTYSSDLREARVGEAIALRRLESPARNNINHEDIGLATRDVDVNIQAH